MGIMHSQCYLGMPMDTNDNPHQTPQWMPQHMPPQHPPQGPPGAPTIPGLPMSPRGQQPPLHVPGTPSLTPAHSPHNTPSPYTHPSSLPNISSSTLLAPASTTAPSGGLSRPNTNANTFTPKRVTIKSESGQEVDLKRWKKQQAPAAVASPITPNSPAHRTVQVRLETEEAKKKRLAEEARKKTEKAKREEEERIRKEEEERERKWKEEERAAREAEEKAKAEVEAPAAAAAASQKETKVKPEEGKVQELDRAVEATDEATKEEAKDKVSNKAPLRIDSSFTSTEDMRHTGRLSLSSAKSQLNPATFPVALATARIIEDIGSVQYPEGVKSPNPELNVNAKQGRFRYDRDFLLQFMGVCKGKPETLALLDEFSREVAEQSFAMMHALPNGGGTRSQRGGKRNKERPSASPVARRSSSGPSSALAGASKLVPVTPSSNAMPPPSRQASVGLGIAGFSKPAVNPFTMGQFSTPNQKMTSDDRFAASSRSTSMSGGPAGIPFGRPSPMVRSSSQGGPGAHPSSGRTRSQRGGKRDKERPNEPPRHGSSFGPSSSLAGVQNLEPVAPLEVSANRWTPASLVRKPQAVDSESPEVVDRKVRSLLNKLTMERFDSISDQIIAWANRSEKEKDGRTLIQVIRLVFEKATDEATWSEMYARLCRKMMEQISPNVHDDGIKNADGKPIAGGQLFRKYLLNRCQEDFECGWVAKEATTASAAMKASEHQVAKATSEENKDGESVLYSDEYYAMQKAKRQGLGLVKFIGELFKLQMLTERIMHGCVKKLLTTLESPEDIESLCTLLTTVGQVLDTPKAREHMDVYFSRMKNMAMNPSVNLRLQRVLQDVINLRTRGWGIGNRKSAFAAAVYEQAAEKLARDEITPPLGVSCGSSRRNGERGDQADAEPSGTVSMSESAAKTHIDEDVKEFFAIRDLQEAEVYFTKLPSEHRHLLVDKLVTKAVESKRADAQLVADLFDRVVSRNLCSPTLFEKGFMPTAEIIDDLLIDAPKALDLLAIMIKGAQL